MVFSGVSPCFSDGVSFGKKISVIPGLRRHCAVRKAPAPRGVSVAVRDGVEGRCGVVEVDGRI